MVFNPYGVPGAWTQVFGDEFEGTAVDITKWQPFWYLEGGVMNDCPTSATNIKVENGRATLRLMEKDGVVTSACMRTTFAADRYQVLVGDFVQARLLLPGDPTEDIYNWPAFWITGKPWPLNGEHDICEGLGGKLKTVYHYKDPVTGEHKQGSKVTPPGTWGDLHHTFGLHRLADRADVYWDGKLVHSYPTYDPGAPQEVVLIVSPPRNDPRPLKFDFAQGLRVEHVRAWRPSA